MFNFSKIRQKLTKAKIKFLEKKHDSEITVLEVEGRRAYIRQPTENEVDNIVNSINENLKPKKAQTQALKNILDLCFVSGDKSVIEDPKKFKKVSFIIGGFLQLLKE